MADVNINAGNISSVNFKQQASHFVDDPASGFSRLYIVTGTAYGGLFLETDSGKIIGPFITGTSVSGDVAADAIWDAAGDLVQGTGANTAARLPIGTANQLLRVNSGATAVEWGSVGRVLISQLTPTGTTVSWTSIPAIYNSLEIEYIARGDNASAYVDAVVELNNDTTATNYRCLIDGGYGASSTYIYGPNDNLIFTSTIPAATATAGYSGSGTIKFVNYASTAFHKYGLARMVAMRSDSGVNLFSVAASIMWANTSAINRIDIILSAGNFLTGSTFRLYGVN